MELFFILFAFVAGVLFSNAIFKIKAKKAEKFDDNDPWG